MAHSCCVHVRVMRAGHAHVLLIVVALKPLPLHCKMLLRVLKVCQRIFRQQACHTHTHTDTHVHTHAHTHTCARVLSHSVTGHFLEQQLAPGIDVTSDRMSVKLAKACTGWAP